MLPMAVPGVISGVGREGVVPAQDGGVILVAKNVGRV